jgi:hypothetical protein
MVIVHQYYPTWIDKFWQRCYLGYLAFTSNDLTPCIKMKNGIIIDIENQRLIIPGDFNLHTTGNLRLTADKHVIIKSGNTPEEREGYIHSIWFNSEEDINGNPIKYDDIFLESKKK